MIDITSPEYPIEIAIRNDGDVIWVNVDGKCVLRVCGIQAIMLNDYRKKSEILANKRRLREEV